MIVYLKYFVLKLFLFERFAFEMFKKINKQKSHLLSKGRRGGGESLVSFLRLPIFNLENGQE